MLLDEVFAQGQAMLQEDTLVPSTGDWITRSKEEISAFQIRSKETKEILDVGVKDHHPQVAAAKNAARQKVGTLKSREMNDAAYLQAITR